MYMHIDDQTLESVKNLKIAQEVHEAKGEFKKARIAHNLITFQCREAVLSGITKIDEANKEQGK